MKRTPLKRFGTRARREAAALQAFRRESWVPWLRVSLGFEIDRARASRASRFPERVPWSDVLYVRRKFNYDPISKRAVHE